MDYQQVFKRYELKYVLTLEQMRRILEGIAPYVTPDQHGNTTIRNLYYDTDDHRLIRRSLEKPVYKEKLRIRSYALAEAQDPVFVELKKKYRGVVYKRRLALPQQEAMDWLAGKSTPQDSQIVREIQYFADFYQGLRPVAYLSYSRDAYYAKAEPDFRVTFDKEIRCRMDGLQLSQPPGGRLLLPEDRVLMELKTAGGIPLWMTRLLTREGVQKMSFSKYGTAYQTMIFKGAHSYV